MSGTRWRLKVHNACWVEAGPILAALGEAFRPLAGYVPAMTNAYGVVLDSASVRWAIAEGMPETLIAAILLLREPKM